MSRPPVAIGSRWHPAEGWHISSDGCYEHRNPRLHLDADSVLVQRALLAPAPPRGNGRIRSALLASAIAVALAAALVYGGQ